MSKYDPLQRHLQGLRGEVELSFDRVEAILGFALPQSARRYAAWWSNSGGTHVQAAAWMGAGYRTEAVNIEAERIRFVPHAPAWQFGETKQSPFNRKAGPAREEGKPDRPYRHPAWGALKGMITIAPGVDLTEPAYGDWKALYGEDR